MSRSSLKLALALGTLWKKVKNIRFSNKLAWGYAVVFAILFGLAFSSVYIISEKYRKQEFYQRLKDRTLTTYKLMVEVEQINYDILKLLDKNTINSLYDEKILLFDSSFHLIYNSIDDAAGDYPRIVLEELKNGQDELEATEGKYEIVGIRFLYKGSTYYGIAKAYDRFGKSKNEFLRGSLLVIFVLVIILLILLSLFLSKVIASPIIKLTRDIENISTEKLSTRISKPASNDEVALLTNKFNELLDRVENAFKFQYHFIHHISHELKTPLTVMISNIEGALVEKDERHLISSLQFQKHALIEVSHIINAMLDISKTEHRSPDILSEHIRLDELLFECIDELSYLNPEMKFDFRIDGSIENSEKLTVSGSSRMLKMAMMNLLKNAFNYSNIEVPIVELNSENAFISLIFSNDGLPILESERSKIFTHLFRGENSSNKKGFGLGLVLVHRIITLHRGKIGYAFTTDSKNTFTIKLPLA